MTLDYYIGIAVGLFSVLLAYVAYVISKLIKGDSMCDRCENLRTKSWNGEYWCGEEGFHYFAPKYCYKYKEKKDEHGSN